MLETLLERLKRRKLFQWALAYLAGAWLAVQVVDVLGEQFLWSLGIQRGITALLAVGFPVVLVLAWYHGEKGHQRVSRPEFVILTSLLVLAGVVLTAVDPFSDVEPAPTATAADFLGPNSIVVLPFVNMSSDPEQEYMSDGLAEELLNLLTRIPELSVVSRTTAFSFKGRDDLTLPEIAAQLGVAHVLEGSVRRSGNTIRVTAQLIEPRTDTHLFSETYDREMDDVFAIQDDIAAKVVEELRVAILGEMPQQREADPEAYALFLRARYVLNLGLYQDQSADTGMALLQRVVEIDPDYAPAHLELAKGYSDLVARGELTLEEGTQMTVAAVERALSLDPDFARARAVLGAIIIRQQGDLAEGAMQIERALASMPTDPEALMMAGMALGYLGRLAEAATVMEYVAQHDPVNFVNLGNLSVTYYFAGRWTELAATCRSHLELNPVAPVAHSLLGLALLYTDDREGALAEAELEPLPVQRLTVLAAANHALGRRSDFEAALQQLRELEEAGDVPPGSSAGIYAYAGDVDAAFALLEGPVEITTILDPMFANLHDDPRWAELLDRLDPSLEERAAIRLEVRLPR